MCLVCLCLWLWLGLFCHISFGCLWWGSLTRDLRIGTALHSTWAATRRQLSWPWKLKQRVSGNELYVFHELVKSEPSNMRSFEIFCVAEATQHFLTFPCGLSVDNLGVMRDISSLTDWLMLQEGSWLGATSWHALGHKNPSKWFNMHQNARGVIHMDWYGPAEETPQCPEVWPHTQPCVTST